MSNIGFKLRQKRKELGLLLTTVAKELSMSASNLSVIERGIKTNPSLNVLKKLSNYYKVPLEYFICEDDTESSANHYNSPTTSFEISESLSPELTKQNNRVLTRDIATLAEDFYKKISSCINDNTINIEPFFISGILENNETKFCLFFDDKFVILKSSIDNKNLIQYISNVFGNPFASFELLEGVLDKCEKISLYCWWTPLCSKADAIKKISGINNSYLVLKKDIHDLEIKKMMIT